MGFDYFYPEQAEQFAFFRIPKALFRDRQFKNISTDAKVLYGLMLDRVSLSVKNQWVDQKGRVYIIFTLEDIMEELGCANQKATKLVVELEEKAGLIERNRQGLGKPTLIYVKNFSRERAEPEIQPDSQTHDFHDSQSHENHESRIMDPMNPDSRKSWSNKTESIKTDSNNTDPFPSSEEEQEENGAEGRTENENLLREQLMMDRLLQERTRDRDLLMESYSFRARSILRLISERYSCLFSKESTICCSCSFFASTASMEPPYFRLSRLMVKSLSSI